jgi:polar amino acid transport system substrate-binding protein
VAALIVTIVAVVSICCSRNGSGSSGNPKVFHSLADFCGARIGSEAGTVFAHFIDRTIPNVEHKYYFSFEEITAALHTGKVDAVSLDVPVALYLTVRDTGLAVFPYVVSVDKYGFAVPKGSRLCEPGNEVLRKFMEDGVIAGAERYWFAAEYGKDKSMPPLNHRADFDGSAGTIRYGCESSLFPMTYAAPDGRVIGFDMDILYRMAYELNMTVIVKTMPFRELIPALLSGRLDMVGGSMTITDERLKSVDFIGPYFEGGTALVVRKENMPAI